MLIIKKTSAQRVDQRKTENKNDEATVYLYSDIGGWFGMDHEQWVKELNDLTASTIHLRIDSDGGDIFAARAMKTAIMQHKAKIIAHIDGLAASAASFIAMGAEEIEMVDGGFIMVHDALSFIDIFGFFNQNDGLELISDLKKEFEDRHDKINKSIANDYVKRSGADLETVLNWMNEETWFTAEAALENNLIDRIYDGEPTKGKYDLSIFNNVPEKLKIRSQTDINKDEKDLSIREAEKALRDAGFSRNRSKEIVAKGFQNESDSQEDVIDHDVREAQNDNDDPQRDAEISDVEELEEDPTKKDRTAELLTRAEMIAQS